MITFVFIVILIVSIGLVARFRSIVNSLLRFFLWRITLKKPCESGYVHCEQADIHYVIYGSGSPIVLLHGGLCNRLCWFAQVPMLSKMGRKIILIETRGHGKSSWGREPFSYPLYARDVICVLDSLCIDSADMIGWSDGGNTALFIAHKFPQRIKHLVAISANYHHHGLTIEARIDQQQLGNRYLQRLKGFLLQNGSYQKLELQLKHLWQTAPNFSAEELKGIVVPILIIAGEKDVVRVEHCRDMANALPHADLSIIRCSGHFSPVTHTAEVNDLIMTFIDRTASTPAISTIF